MGEDFSDEVGAEAVEQPVMRKTFGMVGGSLEKGACLCDLNEDLCNLWWLWGHDCNGGRNRDLRLC